MLPLFMNYTGCHIDNLLPLKALGSRAQPWGCTLKLWQLVCSYGSGGVAGADCGSSKHAAGVGGGAGQVAAPPAAQSGPYHREQN